MRTLLIGLVLSLIATASQAQWVLARENKASKIYTDPSTKRRTDNVVRMWVLYDYEDPQLWKDKTYHSHRAYLQFDCAERTRQILQASLFAGKMASGEVLGSKDEPDRQKFVAPETSFNDMLKIACQ